MRNVNYDDGISKQEARSIADAYLYIYGRYEGRVAFARIAEAESVWAGKVYVVQSAFTPIDAGLPYVLIDKLSGEISWQHGPTLAKIDLDELDNTDDSFTAQQKFRNQNE